MRHLLCLAALITWGCHEGADDIPALPAADAGADAAEPCEPGTVEACTTAGGCVGERGCPGGVRGPCVALPERCDGTDDDCDGYVDEAFVNLGDPCTAGVGACEAPGRVVCLDDGSAAACDARAGEGDDETCNGVDDDCDGMLDEGIDSVPCETGQPGVCAAGGTACVDGAPTCAPLVEATAELCDGVDNDCDGTVDDVDGLGEACTVGLGVCAVEGVQICDLDAAMLRCDATPGAPDVEICDGLDNDCNGAVDDVAGVGEPCTVGVGACAVDGVQICAPAGVVCDATPGEPSAETCDARDEDCDGAVDEQDGGAPLEQSCYDGSPGTEGVGICLSGVAQCVDGAFGGCAGQVLPAAEICDGRDSDCDGTVGDVGGEGCDPAFCGNATVDPGEECDDGNRVGGDGCSAECALEPAFVCTVEGFGLGVTDTIAEGVPPIWQTSDDGLTVTQSENAAPSTYSTSLPVGATYRAAIQVAVDTDIDDDFVGWTVGGGERPLTAPTGPYLLFSWKQVAQAYAGTDAHRDAGLFAARVDGPVDELDLWRSEGDNIAQIAAGVRYGAVGWVDNREYLVELVGDADRLRVYVDGALEFDLEGPLPTGNLGFFTFSQQAFRAELVGPLTLEICRPVEP